MQNSKKLSHIKTYFNFKENDIDDLNISQYANSFKSESFIYNEKVINLLGYKYGDVERTELIKIIREKKIAINLCITDKINDDMIKRMSRYNINLVLKDEYLHIAKKLKEYLGIDYILFDDTLDKYKVCDYYKDVAQKLNIDVEEKIKKIKQETIYKLKQYSLVLKDKKFIINKGNLNSFKVAKFLMDMGLHPIAIRYKELNYFDKYYIDEILKRGYDPYVSRREYTNLDDDIIQIKIENMFETRGFELMSDLVEYIIKEYLKMNKSNDVV